MKIRGGHSIEVYRKSTSNRHGDGAGVLVGTIDNVVFQWSSPDPIEREQENDSLSTVVYCPRDSQVKLQARDRFKFNNETYQVVGDRSWDENHPATGHNFGYYMMQVQVTG